MCPNSPLPFSFANPFAGEYSIFAPPPFLASALLDRFLLQESAVFLIGPEGFPAVGKILDELVACTHGLLAKLKMVTSV